MNNNNNEKPSFLKGKGAAVAVVICFVAMIASVGAYTFSNYQDKMNQQVAEAQEDKSKEESQATTTDDIVLPEEERNTSDTEEKDEKTDTAKAEKDAATAGNTTGVWFDETSTLEWPASGAILISYSMDQTVYFSTLEQYKYNPALIIGGEAGEEIGASAAGIVTNIEQTAQTGTTVTLDMGNGYSAVYGQLKEVPLAVGDYVGAGELIGYMSEPTKYYSVEGTNLYFEVVKDGEPVNPLDFMEG